MIALPTLKYLASQKYKDSISLFQKERNAGAIYLMGYAIEFALKRKISLTLNFSNGFPESKADLRAYSNQLADFNSISRRLQLTQISQIRNHKLYELLSFSGTEAKIISSFHKDWATVNIWSPENRYLIQRFTREKTWQFLKSARIILREIS